MPVHFLINFLQPIRRNTEWEKVDEKSQRANKVYDKNVKKREERASKKAVEGGMVLKFRVGLFEFKYEREIALLKGPEKLKKQLEKSKTKPA